MTDNLPVWTPSTEETEHSEMALLMRAVGAADYNDLWQWSVDDVGRFWRTVWDRYDIRADGDPTVALASTEMPGATWFPDVRLSFPEHIFRGRDLDDVAIHAFAEDSGSERWTWRRLTEETARVRAGLQAMGVGRGDRVAAYLPNVPETIAAFLAVSALGAIWSCCSPDFGSRTAVDRLAQIEPKILLHVNGYRFNGQDFDRRDAVAELKASLPTLQRTVALDRPGLRTEWEAAFPVTEAPLTFERVPFDHPLWVVYSSGTTGLPKAIVHGHGGLLLEQLKLWRLHHDVGADDVVLWYTSTGWVMWNAVVGALLSGASIVIYDGSPAFPDWGTLWDVAETADVTVFGAGAAYFHGCMKRGVEPGQGRNLGRLRAISSSASPLAPEAYHWVAEKLGKHVWLSSSSGGTDVAGGFVGGSPLMPVYAGEIPSRMLGVAVESWDDDGHPLVDRMGEMVVTAPMPSMPVFFWNDPNNERYRESYFSMCPGVWRHGDWIRITERGSAVIYGRSDSTINRGGVRMGTAEIYAAVMAIDEIVDALVVDVPDPNGLGAGNMTLFVVTADGVELSDAMCDEVRERIRRDCSPRHVPDHIVAVPAVPRTLTGKVLEVPVKKLLMGRQPDEVASRDALADPDAFDWFVDYAARAAT
ncbi:MAG TPA: acetoacetate--CoA ligase [Mycobacterium sp.]|nr:acetoacetate--CoA ligase [Mycobacterium sp.]